MRNDELYCLRSNGSLDRDTPRAVNQYKTKTILKVVNQNQQPSMKFKRGVGFCQRGCNAASEGCGVSGRVQPVRDHYFVLLYDHNRWCLMPS
jgi:hypothetical protein